jgi:dethiobiotin synthetase
MKPVAAGCVLTAAGLRNEDALALNGAANVKLPYELLNPYAFEPGIAPHIAAADGGTVIELRHLVATYAAISARADVVIVEGAGGWRVPLFPSGYLSDFPEALALPVVLVVGLRLGCINHAVMTAELVAQGGARLAGWIGNQVDPGFARVDENIATLRRLIPAPCLGVVPRLTHSADDAIDHIALDSLCSLLS